MKHCLAICTLLLLLSLASNLAFKHHQSTLDEGFCWRDSYLRSGTIPTSCQTTDKIGLQCFEKCPAGYSRVGFNCYQNCPTDSGWADQGLYCRLVEYGRGVGYGWQISDGFSNSGMFSRCEKDNGQGNCELSGAIVYPKCKAGFSAFGCCICRPAVPNCEALGYNNGVDLSCAKNVILGASKSMSCDGGLHFDNELCYPPCKAGYYGVGPVCWQNTPPGWNSCGMAVAKTQCLTIGFDQVMSIGDNAFNLAAVLKGLMFFSRERKPVDINKQFQDLKNLISANQKVQEMIAKEREKPSAIEAGKNVFDVLRSDYGLQATPADIIRVAARIAQIIDVTGVAKKVAAYSFPKCTDIKL